MSRLLQVLLYQPSSSHSHGDDLSEFKKPTSSAEFYSTSQGTQRNGKMWKNLPDAQRSALALRSTSTASKQIFVTAPFIAGRNNNDHHLKGNSGILGPHSIVAEMSISISLFHCDDWQRSGRISISTSDWHARTWSNLFQRLSFIQQAHLSAMEDQLVARKHVEVIYFEPFCFEFIWIIWIHLNDNEALHSSSAFVWEMMRLFSKNSWRTKECVVCWMKSLPDWRVCCKY